MELALAKSCWAAGDAEPGPPPPAADDARRLRRGEGGGVAQRQALLPAMQIVVDSRDSAAKQMAMDEALARTARATFRLFRWQRPAVSLGFKQPPPAWVEPGALAGHGIEVVERPTGGGIAIHGSDLSFSVVVPRQQSMPLAELMAGIAQVLSEAVSRFDIEAELVGGDAGAGAPAARAQFPSGGVREAAAPETSTDGGVAQAAGPATRRIVYCLTQESPYALMIERRKLCGLAVRRYQASWLIQGSLLVSALPAAFAQVMPAEVFEAFQARAITLEEAAGRLIDEEELLTELIGAWRQTWSTNSHDAL